MRKHFSTLSAILFILSSLCGQRPTFKSLPGFNDGTATELVGKYGTLTFLLQHHGSAPYKLLLLDDSLQTLSTHVWPLWKANQQPLAATFSPSGKGAVLIAQHQDSTDLLATITQWNEKGELKDKKEVALGIWNDAQPIAANLFAIAYSATGNYHLFYQSLLGLASDSVVFKGVLFNDRWEKVKDFMFLLPMAQETELLHPALVDREGNIHLLVYDRPENFRLSTHAIVYTCALLEESLTIEEFLFKGKKLKDLHMKEQVGKPMLEAQALYNDKNSPDVAGLALLRLPFIRLRTSRTVFYPFSDVFRKALQKNYSVVSTRRIMNDLVLLEGIDVQGDKQVHAMLMQVPRPLLNNGKGMPQPAINTHAVQDYVQAKKAILANSERNSTTYNQAYLLGNVLANYEKESRTVSAGQTPSGPKPGLQAQPARLLTFRFDSLYSFSAQQWTELRINLGQEDNAVLSLQQGDSLFYITYAEKAGKQELMSYLMDTNKKPIVVAVNILPGTCLRLSQAIRLDANRYLVPYYNHNTGDTGIGLLYW